MFTETIFVLDQRLEIAALTPLSDHEQEMVFGGFSVQYSSSTTIETSSEATLTLSTANHNFSSTSNSNYSSTGNTSFSLSGNPNPSRRHRSFLSRLI